jgi:Fe2+ transport system protein FeoA
MSLENFAMGVAEDTSDRAVRRILDMGFTYEDAIEALRLTDMGDGLRVDRAVDLLLKRIQ